MIILDSARKHGVSDYEMLNLIADPYVVYELESDSEKLLHLGFDTKARAIEVISDSGKSGKNLLFMLIIYLRIMKEFLRRCLNERKYQTYLEKRR